MKTVACLFLLLVSLQAAAPNYFLTTAAGVTPLASSPIALNQPANAQDVGYDPAGDLYYADRSHIWRLNADGTDTLIAGSFSAQAGYTERGLAVNVPLTITDFQFDGQNNLFIADTAADKIYKVTNGVITTFAGTGSYNADVLPIAAPGVPAASVAIEPTAMTVGPDGTVYVSTLIDNNKLNYYAAILSFTNDGRNSSVVVSKLQFGPNFHDMTVSGDLLFVERALVSVGTSPTGLVVNLQNGATVPLPASDSGAVATGLDGSVYLFYNGLLKVNPQTLAGQPVTGGASLNGTALAINPLTGDIAVANGTVSVLNSSGALQVAACNPPVFGGDGGPAVLAVLKLPGALATDSSGNLYIAGGARIRKMTPEGIITTIAGNGTYGASGDSMDALQAEIAPGELGVDRAGNVYFINSIGEEAGSIRKIDTSGRITTIAGGGSAKLAGGASGTGVSMNPSHLAVDVAGNVYFDGINQVFKMDSSGNLTLLAGTGKVTQGFSEGDPAVGAGIGQVSSIAVDNAGTVYIGDMQHEVLASVDPEGLLHIVAGRMGSPGFSVISGQIPAGPAVGTNIDIPENIVTDAQGNIYFFGYNYGGDEILVVDPSGNLTPIAGLSFKLSGSSTGDGGDATLGSFTSISGLAISPNGNLYVSDGSVIRQMARFDPSSPPPFLPAGSVIGAGGSVPPVQAVSYGGEVSIFGANFVAAADQRTLQPSDLVDGKAPTKLAGVCVNFGSLPAAMLGVYPSQLNVQAGALPPGAVTVQVTVNCGTPQAVVSNFGGVLVQAASPEFYSFAPDPIGGHNPIAAVNALTGAFIGPPGLIAGVAFVPAKPGDIVQAYATGFGATTPAYGLGVIPGAAGTVNAPYSLTLGGEKIPQASIEYVGISPCCAGFYQLDFTVPAGAPSGALPLVITISGVGSPPGAYIQVQ